MNLNKFKNNFLSKINRGYGYKNYPEKFKFKFYLKKKIFSEKKNLKKKAGNNFNLELPSKNILVNPIDILKKKNFKDREDFSALHRWTWIIKVLSKKKRIPISKIINLEKTIINWCIIFQSEKIDKKNIIFEPYNISERICNYIILINLKILKPNKFILDNLENQYLYLIKNIEYYKYKLSNHSMNNLRAIILFSNYINDEKVINYSYKFFIFLINNYIDKNGFFKFGSSNYQFIFSKWLYDVVIFTKNKNRKFKKKLNEKLKKNQYCT